MVCFSHHTHKLVHDSTGGVGVHVLRLLAYKCSFLQLTHNQKSRAQSSELHMPKWTACWWFSRIDGPPPMNGWNGNYPRTVFLSLPPSFITDHTGISPTHTRTRLQKVIKICLVSWASFRLWHHIALLLMLNFYIYTN